MAQISVVVPVYKVEKYLNRCVKSLLSQTFTDFELILVDDGSPDLCGEMCEEYARADNRVCVLHRENGGLSAARNTGIEWALKNSDSKWITFIDSDDWVSPVYLESLMNAADKYNADVVIGTFVRKKEYEEPNKETISISEYKVEDYWMKNQTNATVAWAKLYKKDDFGELRYPEGKLHEDEFTTYRILYKYLNVAVIEEPIYFYYYNPDSIMKSAWSPKRLDGLEAVENQISFFKSNHYNRAYRWAAWCYLDAICDHMRAVRDSDQYQNYTPSLRKKLRIGIKQYKKDLSLTYQTGFRFYKYAYPLKSKIYRKLRMG